MLFVFAAVQLRLFNAQFKHCVLHIVYIYAFSKCITGVQELHAIQLTNGWILLRKGKLSDLICPAVFPSRACPVPVKVRNDPRCATNYIIVTEYIQRDAQRVCAFIVVEKICGLASERRGLFTPMFFPSLCT